MSANTRPFDNTALSTLDVCEQEFVYRHVLGLNEPAGEDRGAGFGVVLHKAIAALWEGQEVSAAIAAMGTVPTSAKPWLSQAYAEQLVTEYAQLIPLSQYELVMSERYLADGNVCGIVDRVVRRKSDSKLYIRDLKTTGFELSPAWVNQYRMNEQVSGYFELVEHALGQEVSGFWLDAIHLRRTGKIHEGDIIEFGPFAYSPALRAELADMRQRKIRRAEQLIADPTSALKSTKSCLRFGRLCPFFEVCRANPLDRADRLAAQLDRGALVHAPWRPDERA